MDKIIAVILLIFVVTIVFETNAFQDEDLTNVRECNNTLLENETEGACWCMGNLSIKCDLENNLRMGLNLERLFNLSYTYMETLVFVLNNSWLGKYPVIEIYHLDINLLEHFTALQKLYIFPSRLQTHAVPLIFTKTTFRGCNKIRELHINIPLVDIDLYHMIKPLKNLEILDLTNVRGISLRNMTKSIQGLTKNIRKLWLSHFQTIGQTEYLTVLIPAQFLVGKFENLTEIDLSNNGFSLVYTGWYNATPNLQFLDMSHNLLTCSTNSPFITEVLMHPSIRVLNISYQGFYDPLSKETSIRFINQSNQSSRDFYEESSSLPFVANISKEIIRCINIMTHGNITNLFGKDKRVFCDVIRNCTYPSWKYFACELLPPLDHLINLDCTFWIKIPLGKNLAELYNSHNYLDPMSNVGIIFSGTICFVQNQLRKLDFSNNFFWANNAQIAESLSAMTNIIGLRSLRELNLAQNDFHLDVTAASINFPNLSKINLAGNFVHITANASLCADKAIHSLKELDLSLNNLTENNWQVVKDCKHLRSLSLAGNRLGSSLFINLAGAHRLERIDLSSNYIQTLSEVFQTELDAAGKITINISNNPLICGCSERSLAFIKWMDSEYRKTKLADESTLLCVGTNGPRLLSTVKYRDLWRECSDIIPIATGVASSLGAVCAVAIITSVVRLRFRIQYKLFTFQQWLKHKFDKRTAGENKTRYEYDAFVSYSSEDRFWVHDVLMKTLEEKYGFKLVIHYRDIPLGMNVQRAIDDRMRKSREFILVLTENFLESDWCQMEMEEAYRESLIRHKHLAIIVLGNVPTRINNPTAVTILDQHNYLHWEADEKERSVKEEKETSHKRKLFWAKLVHHLYGNSASCNCCCAFGPSALGYREVSDFAGNENEAADNANVPLPYDAAINSTMSETSHQE